MSVPNYVAEEFEKYREQKANNKASIITYENIKGFIGLAYVNGRIFDEEKENLFKELDNI